MLTAAIIVLEMVFHLLKIVIQWRQLNFFFVLEKNIKEYQEESLFKKNKQTNGI